MLAIKERKIVVEKIFEIDIEKVCDVPLNTNSMYRALGHDIGVNKNILLNTRIRDFATTLSILKPHLNENNMKGRLRFFLSMLEESRLSHDPQFKSMYNLVHID